ncbi:MAG: ATP-dependent Clp protease adapter ClpS [Pseudobdellovibrionaceae bacterium]|nr:MAG: ATP-dependent Clp protease adapter ClpS [Pseudobdellovibrionaceae bacterium]
MKLMSKNLIPLGADNNHASGSDDGFGTGTQTLTRPKTRSREPSLYKVVILNDDFTPMDFVVHVLEKFFRKTPPEATEIMLAVHNKGAGVAGVFSYELAETKVYQVNDYSRRNQHPLKCIMEKA